MAGPFSAGSMSSSSSPAKFSWSDLLKNGDLWTGLQGFLGGLDADYDQNVLNQTLMARSAPQVAEPATALLQQGVTRDQTAAALNRSLDPQAEFQKGARYRADLRVNPTGGPTWNSGGYGNTQMSMGSIQNRDRYQSEMNDIWAPEKTQQKLNYWDSARAPFSKTPAPFNTDPMGYNQIYQNAQARDAEARKLALQASLYGSEALKKAQQGPSKTGGVLSGAASGAMLGSKLIPIPGWGTAIGAGIGGLLGLFGVGKR